MPNISAACVRLPLLKDIARFIASRSKVCRLSDSTFSMPPMVRDEAEAMEEVSSRMSSADSSGLSFSTIDRSMQCCSSRTLPGHVCCMSFFLAEAPSATFPTLYLPEYIFRKCSANKMMSSPRSRNGGRCNSIVLRR